MLSNGEVKFFTNGSEPILNDQWTPNFNRPHLQIQLKMQIDTHLFEVEVWHFDVDHGYSMKRRFVSILSKDSTFAAIRFAVREWIEDGIPAIHDEWIIKELPIFESPTFGER